MIQAAECRTLFFLEDAMSGDRLKQGDMVVYIDCDCIRWGPWIVVDVSENMAEVQIETHVSYVVRQDLLEVVFQKGVFN